MNRRLVLSRLVGAFFLILILAFSWVFFNGIGSSSFFSKNEASGDEFFSDLRPGDSVLRRYKREMVWVTLLNDRLREQLIEAMPYLVNPESGCIIDQAYCAVSANTTMDAIYLQYSEKEPQQLPSGVPWSSGYVDPTNGDVYDLLGRAYRIKSDNKQSLDVIIIE